MARRTSIFSLTTAATLSRDNWTLVPLESVALESFSMSKEQSASTIVTPSLSLVLTVVFNICQYRRNAIGIPQPCSHCTSVIGRL